MLLFISNFFFFLTIMFVLFTSSPKFSFTKLLSIVYY